MHVGGSAFNSGVNFATENNSVKFVMAADGSFAISTRKRLPKRGLARRVRKIPLLRGLYALFFATPPVCALLITSTVVMDFLPASPANERLINLASAALFLFLLAYLVKNMLYKLRDTWMYHGAEHKTIYAVEHQLPLTLDSVRACPRVARRCGTNMAVFLLVFFIPLGFFSAYESLAMIAAWMLAYELFDLDKGDTLPITRLFFKLGNWCQQHIFTLEPSDAQLNAAIAAMEKLQELEGVKR